MEQLFWAVVIIIAAVALFSLCDRSRPQQGRGLSPSASVAPPANPPKGPANGGIGIPKRGRL
jgi:hypothetical protein